MACSHSNPVGYAFCGVCGHALEVRRCRCGFAAQLQDAFCGRCGVSLAETRENSVDAAAVSATAADFRYRFEDLVAAAKSSEGAVADTSSHVSQDDIERLFAMQQEGAE